MATNSYCNCFFCDERVLISRFSSHILKKCSEHIIRKYPKSLTSPLGYLKISDAKNKKHIWVSFGVGSWSKWESCEKNLTKENKEIHFANCKKLLEESNTEEEDVQTVDTKEFDKKIDCYRYALSKSNKQRCWLQSQIDTSDKKLDILRKHLGDEEFEELLAGVEDEEIYLEYTPSKIEKTILPEVNLELLKKYDSWKPEL